MPSISKINEQLLSCSKLIKKTLEDFSPSPKTLELLCNAQKALIESQVMIFIECTESEIDMPTLPLFIEERDESDSEE